MKLLHSGETEGTIVDLIRVRPEQEAFLRRELGRRAELETSLQFRLVVEHEFFKLIARQAAKKR